MFLMVYKGSPYADKGRVKKSGKVKNEDSPNVKIVIWDKSRNNIIVHNGIYFALYIGNLPLDISQEDLPPRILIKKMEIEIKYILKLPPSSI